jgi:hypothetical protein
MCDGAFSAMLPVFTISQFGTKRGPDVYSVMFTVFGVTSFVNLTVVQNLKPIIGYSGLFILGGCTTLLAAFINLFLNT